MKKSLESLQQQQQHQIVEIPADDAELCGPHLACCRTVGRAFSLRCAAAVLLSASLLLSSLFWFPLFRSRTSGYFTDDPHALAADIKASFIVEKPFPLLLPQIGRLEYEILGEIGVPNTKVSIISMHPLTATNSTNVVFAVVPNQQHASISLPALSVLRSSLVELVLRRLNLSLTPSIFGQPSVFEVLKFPGGITVIPSQSASIWEITQDLFNFTLHSSIVQIQKDLEELKAQLKYGLNLRSYENVYVQMTNVNGSTVSPPVIVEAAVLSDFGSRSLQPDRLKQLAQEINGSRAGNLGLNHSVFGKVKSVVLSSYLEHSVLSPGPSPSPSQSQSPSPSPSPSPSAGTPSAPSPSPSPTHPSHAPVPSPSQPRPPCLYCSSFPPSESPSYAPEPQNRPQPPSQPSISPAPSVPNIVSPPRHGPCFSSSPPPSASPSPYPHTPAPTNHAPNPAISPYFKPLAPSPQMAPPKSSPSSPAVTYNSSPPPKRGSGKNPIAPISASPDISPSPISNSSSGYADKRLIWLLGGSLVLHLLLGCRFTL